MLKQFIALLCFGILTAPAQAGSAPGNGFDDNGPVIHTEDVQRFYAVYDAADGNPDAELLQREYLDEGTPGLHTLAERRNVTAAAIAESIDTNPALYVDARRCVEVLPQARKRLADALSTLADIYPEARFPSVTIAIGKGKPVGIGGPDIGVQIGLEALCAVEYLNPDIEDRFVYVIAHEFVHVQQASEFVDDEQPTVLQISLVEGAAEFVTELIAGGVAYSWLPEMTAGREKEIETAFAADRNKTDLSDWVYNGTLDEPGDIGYWVGYRIAKSYYQHADDKEQALHDILHVTDAEAFLQRSGWQPGMQLE